MISRNNPPSPPSAKDKKDVSKKINSDDPNWRTTKKTVSERNAVLFNNDFMSDVKFLVGKDGDIQAIPAHKLILATGSSVFYSMFYGDLAERNSEIRLPDVEPSAFLNLLKYLYFDEINLEDDNVLATLYVAKKYIVHHLTKACANYIGTKVTAEDACFLLTQSLLFDEPDLIQHCWKFIDGETESVIKSDGFLDVDQKILESILSRDTLTCREIDLFEATVKWADAACKKMEIELTPQNRRDVLGQTLKMIRFPIMDLKEFANRVVNLEILTSDESIDIFRFLTADYKPNILNFSTKERTRSLARSEREDVKKISAVEFINREIIRTYNCINSSTIEIAVNKKISIIGFAIAESLTKIEPTNYDADIQLYHGERLLAENSTKFSKDLSSKSWRVLFKDPVPIDQDTFYTFNAYFKNEVQMDSYGVRESVSDGNVRFNFRSSITKYYGGYWYEQDSGNVFSKIIYSE